MKKLALLLAALLCFAVFFSACEEKTTHYSSFAAFELDVKEAAQSPEMGGVTVTFQIKEILDYNEVYDSDHDGVCYRASELTYFYVTDENNNPIDAKVGDVITVKITGLNRKVGDDPWYLWHSELVEE